jgi:hypothetical protein
MRTHDSRPVLFIGQASLPEFDHSQPLPDKISVLLWMLDGAERRHRLAKQDGRRIGMLDDEVDLQVNLRDDEIIVTLPGTNYAVKYCKPTKSPELYGKNFPEQVDRRSPISQAEFVAKAWSLANDKARELGWIK